MYLRFFNLIQSEWRERAAVRASPMPTLDVSFHPLVVTKVVRVEEIEWLFLCRSIGDRGEGVRAEEENDVDDFRLRFSEKRRGREARTRKCKQRHAHTSGHAA